MANSKKDVAPKSQEDNAQDDAILINPLANGATEELLENAQKPEEEGDIKLDETETKEDAIIIEEEAEKKVKVRTLTTIRCSIGGHEYSYPQDVEVKLPASVAQILIHAKHAIKIS